MQANDNTEGEESREQILSDIINEDADTNDLDDISFNAFLGNTIGTTMKLQGTLNGRKVLLLVDSGSSHNFISEEVVEELQLPAQVCPTSEFRQAVNISYVATLCAKILL